MTTRVHRRGTVRRLLLGPTLAAFLAAGGAFATPVAAADLLPETQQAVSGAIEPAALASGQLRVIKVVGGFSSPLGVTHAGDGSGRLFVVEQGGRVRIVKGGKIAGTFLDIASNVTSGGERGLLGFAFHPDSASNGYVYAYYTRPGGDIQVSRFTANAERTSVDPGTEYFLLDIEHSQYSNHNGGAIAFGPDGYLYIATGDGGGAGDPLENGQDITALLGKILRIDVNGSGAGPHGHYAIPPVNPFVGASGDDEIWDYGLRNPWRISFDGTTGDLYIGDVGQGSREEVDLEGAADPGGNNYGWDVREGTLCYEPSNCSDPPNYVGPVAEYSHTYGCAITGGYVYRGSHQDLQGLYVYGDYRSGRIWTMNANGSGETLRLDTSLNISSFGESEPGERYLTDLNGSLTG